MRNIYSFNFNVGGFKIVINVIDNCIATASKKAYERCAENVGDNFKREALRGDYLVSVDITRDILE